MKVVEPFYSRPRPRVRSSPTSRATTAPASSTTASPRSSRSRRSSAAERRARPLRPSRPRHRRQGRARLPRRADVRRGSGRAEAARPARRPRAGLHPERRLRRPGRGGVDAAALRDRADDRAPGLEHGHGADAVHARDARGAPAGDVRTAGQRGRGRPARHRGHRVRRLVVCHRRARRTSIADPGGRRIEADRVISLPALEGRRLPGVPCDDDGLHPGRRPRARPASRRRLRGRRRHQLPHQAGRPRDPAGGRRGRGDRGGGRRRHRARAVPARCCAACS